MNFAKRQWFFLLVMALLLLLTLTACGGKNAGIDNEPEQPLQTAASTETPAAAENNTPSAAEATADTAEKSLVVYFSWSGNLQQMSRWVADETGSDIYRITPKEAYSTDYEDCADRAKNELDNGIRPELDNLPDADTIAQYDVIYIGFPIWWYDLPMSVVSFLEQYDMSGKTIVPFFSHNGSSSGANSLTTLESLCPNSTVLTDQVLSVAMSKVDSSEADVRAWVNGLDLG